MKNKTKKIVKILSAIILVVLLQTMGYTYAKYIAQEDVTGRAEVAKWAFQIVKDREKTQKINLADTVTKTTLVDGKIAPGTSGMIFIELDATGSEVDLDYCLEFKNEQNKPNNLYFSYQGSVFTKLSDIHPIEGTIRHGDEARKKRIAVGWQWPYETGNSANEIASNDIIDTENANLITEFTFDAVVTASQSE